MYGDLCQPWPVIWCGEITGVSPAVTGDALMAASEILWMATGHRFGNCAISLRGCRRDCSQFPGWLPWWDSVSSMSSWGWPFPMLIDGLWFNLACGGCGDSCSCSSFSSIRFPEPVQSIESITIDGESLPASGYYLLDGQDLIKTEGEWPRCQDWHVTGGPGSWIINAAFGDPVPTLGQMAVGILTIELAKLFCGDRCAFPARTTSVTRQGVSYQIASAKDFLDDGLTGLDLPDRFIKMVNPQGIPDRARAYNVDDFLPRIQGG